MKDRIKANFASQPEALLTIGLLSAAMVIASIALLPGKKMLKVSALAWVILP